MEYIASSNELRKINYAIKKGKKEIDISLDLGKTLSKIQLNKDEIILPDKTKVKPDKIKDKDKNCYIIKNNKFINPLPPLTTSRNRSGKIESNAHLFRFVGKRPGSRQNFQSRRVFQRRFDCRRRRRVKTRSGSGSGEERIKSNRE